MKAYVEVALKKTVLDPQGQTIQAALARLGYSGIEGLRQGKLFEVQLRPGLDAATAREQVERAAREVLTNPVMEEFSVRLVD